MKSFFGYSEEFPVGRSSLASYKFSKWYSFGLVRIMSRCGQKNLLWIFRRNFRAPLAAPRGWHGGWKRAVYLLKEVSACIRGGNTPSIKPQRRAAREHWTSDSPSSSSPLRHRSFITRAFNINQLLL